MAKKTIVNEVASVLGTAAARVENLKPKRATAAKHSKATKVATSESGVQEPVASSVEPPEVQAAVVNEVVVDPGEVARLAYLYWEARGGQGGSPEQDWLAAEQQVKAKAAGA
ncbi:MAG: hypothetical protein JWO80_1730 [Bryobacterales bacterium]|nr:hypothetical protein [Bryobacterales bacterium]